MQELSAQRIAEIIAEVQICTVDGLVAAAPGKDGFTALSRDDLKAQTHSKFGIKVTSGGHWLVHRLLREMFPASLTNMTAELKQHGISSSLFSHHYHQLGPAAAVRPELAEKIVGLAAPHDAELAEDLHHVLALTPNKSLLQFTHTYLHDQLPPRPARVLPPRIERVGPWPRAGEYAQVLKACVDALQLGKRELYSGLLHHSLVGDPVIMPNSIERILAGGKPMPAYGFRPMAETIQWHQKFHQEEYPHKVAPPELLEQLETLTQDAERHEAAKAVEKSARAPAKSAGR